MELDDFMLVLACNRKALTMQAYRTLAGQAKHGDIKGAEKGLRKILRRGSNIEKQKNAR